MKRKVVMLLCYTITMLTILRHQSNEKINFYGLAPYKVQAYAQDDTNKDFGHEIKNNIRKSKKIKKLSKNDFRAEYNGETHNILKILKENKEYARYFAFDSTVDKSKKDIIKTNRGIHIGDSQNKVIKKYGEIKENQVILGIDLLYLSFLEENMNKMAKLMKKQCYSYILYTYDDKGIKFYFDKSNKVSWIVFLNQIHLLNF